MRYTTFTLAGEAVAGTMLMPDEVPVAAPAFWSVYFAVDDCAAAEARVAELGGEVLRPTASTGEGRFAVAADPTGASFQLMDPAADRSATSCPAGQDVVATAPFRARP